MYVYMYNHTVASSTTNLMVWSKPHKFPVTVSSCLVLRCDTSVTSIFIGLIGGKKYSKGFSLFFSRKSVGAILFNLSSLNDNIFYDFFFRNTGGLI